MPAELPVTSDCSPTATVPVIIPSVPDQTPGPVPSASVHVAGFPHDLVSVGNRSALLVPVSINEMSFQALIDSGSTVNAVSSHIAAALCLEVRPISQLF